MAGRVRLELAELAPGELRAVQAGNVSLVVCNVAGELHALEDRCPHADAKLSDGRLEGFLLECPLHGGKLDVRDGSPQRPPIRRSAASFRVQPAAGGIEIDLG